MKTVLTFAQIIVSVLLAASILLQSRGADAGSIFGGGSGDGNVYTTKRGIERVLFITTIVLAVLFLGVSLANVMLK